MDKQSIECLTTIQSKGQEQYGTFVDERLRANIKPITATITRNKVVLFNEQAHKSKKAGTQVNLLKSESSLFARRLHARQEMVIWTISSAMKIIRFHHPFLPGQLRLGEKSDLMGCLEQHVQSPRDSRPETDVSIMDGAVLVNFLRPGGCKTFGDYAANVFVPHIKIEQNKAQRVDIV